jgi:hypothetical protein
MMIDSAVVVRGAVSAATQSAVECGTVTACKVQLTQLDVQEQR